MDKNRVEIFASIKGKTVMAVLVNTGEKDVWIPMSLLTNEQRDEVRELEPGDSFDFEIPEWFVDQKDMML